MLAPGERERAEHAQRARPLAKPARGAGVRSVPCPAEPQLAPPEHSALGAGSSATTQHTAPHSHTPPPTHTPSSAPPTPPPPPPPPQPPPATQSTAPPLTCPSPSPYP